MELVLKRIFKGDKYTIGRLYWKPPYIDYGEHEEVLKDQYNDDIEKEYICDTLEDTDRGLTKDMTLDEIKSINKKVLQLYHLVSMLLLQMYNLQSSRTINNMRSVMVIFQD